MLKIKFPLFLSFILAGLRITVVIAISVATLAPYFGEEGLGRELIYGITANDSHKIYGAAIMAALLAIIADFLFGQLQKKLDVKE